MSKRRTWVLLRGLIREQRHWGTFPDVLQACLPDDEIILFDFAGNGQRNNEKSAATIDDMVNDVRSSVIHSHGQPVYIIALSMGAMVAVEWMNQHPEECAGAVLISTSLRGLNPFYKRLLPSNYPRIIRSLIFPEVIYEKEDRILKMVSNLVVDDAIKRNDIVNQWVDYAQQNPVSAINGIRQLIAAMRFRVPDKQPEVPILVLRSMADHMVSPDCSATLATHWQLPMESHDSAGHDIPLDDAEWVCEKIARWI